jgi:hypothetical protein
VAGIDWTIVIASAIPTVPATLAVIVSAANRRSLKTPSGDAIGHVVERTHDLAAVAAAGIGMTAQPALSKSAERLDADENSPVKVNGESATIPHFEEGQ